MATPPVNAPASMMLRIAGTRHPYSTELLAMRLISVSGRPCRLGVNPMSRISTSATTNMSRSTTARTTNGTPRLVACARKPPPADPPSVAAPVMTCARPNTASSEPS